jgi:hypothetical protein
MLDVLREIKEYDTIFFVPHPEDDNQTKLEIAEFKNKGEKIGGSEMGDNYDIILFRLNEDCDIKDLERFEAILIDPREYVSRLVKQDWYGMVSRKTTTSDEMANGVFAKWSSMCYNQT